MEFVAALIKTPDDSEFLTKNCTHVINEYWIYEGATDLLLVNLTFCEVIAEGEVPELFELSQKELINRCQEWFGIDVSGKGAE